MKINLKHKTAFDLTASSTVEAPQINQIFDTVYKEIVKSANIKGFRKHKTPLSVIKTSFSARATSMVLNELVKTVIANLESKSINILELTTKDLIKKNPPVPNKKYELSLDFKIQPVLKVNTKLVGMTLDRPKNSIAPEDTEKQINFFKKMGAIKKLASSRGAKEDDILIIDVDVEIDGVYSNTLSKKPGVIYLTKDSMYPVMYDNLIGIKPFEEKEFLVQPNETVNFENFFDNFKKKYSVKLYKIIEHIEPELDEEFLKKINLDSKSKLHEVAKKRAQISIQKKVRLELEDKIRNTLFEDQQIEVSKEDLNAQVSFLKVRLSQMMYSFGFSNQKIEKNLKLFNSQIEKESLKQCSLDLIFSHLIKNLKITVSSNDMEEKIKLIHLTEGVPLSSLKKKYSDRQNLIALEFSIAKDKVFDYIISNANFIDSKVKQDEVN